MNSKLLLATLVGALVAFFGGWLIWGTLMDSYFQEHAVKYPGLMRDEASFMERLWAIGVANLVMSFLFAWIFQKWAGVKSLVQGFIWGAFIGGMMGVSMDLMQWSMMNLMSYKVYIVDMLVNAAYWGIVGAAVAAVLGSGKKAATA